MFFNITVNLFIAFVLIIAIQVIFSIIIITIQKNLLNDAQFRNTKIWSFQYLSSPENEKKIAVIVKRTIKTTHYCQTFHKSMSLLDIAPVPTAQFLK